MPFTYPKVTLCPSRAQICRYLPQLKYWKGTKIAVEVKYTHSYSTCRTK